MRMRASRQDQSKYQDIYLLMRATGQDAELVLNTDIIGNNVSF